MLQEGRVVAVVRQCSVCGKWKPVEHFESLLRKVCDACRRDEGKCQECGAGFVTRRHHGATSRRFCSGLCRQRHNKKLAIERDLMDPEPSPVKWDGRTVYSERPQLRDYFLTCMMCARQDALKLSDSDARNIPQQRCQHCSGRMMLELDAGRATLQRTRLTIRNKSAWVAELEESAI